MKCLLAAASSILILAVNAPAHARHFHHRHHAASNLHATAGCEFTDTTRMVCGSASFASAPRIIARTAATVTVIDEGTVIGRRPEGCPHAYCGCGLRKYLGLNDARLNLAYNWARLFPRVATPGPGLAAVRGGHVMYIEAAAGNGQWTVRDYNSGGGLSRLHTRDVRGYIFVNPRGTPSA